MTAMQKSLLSAGFSVVNSRHSGISFQYGEPPRGKEAAMKTLGYYNGVAEEAEKLRIPALDRACYFGDGVYDVTYSRNYRIFAMEEHIANLFRSAAAVEMEPRITPDEAAALLRDLVARMDTGENRIYIQFSRGTAPRAHAFPHGESRPNLLVLIFPAAVRDPYRPMRCITRPDTRFFHCNVKSLNLLPNVLASEAAERAGADECILHRNGVVTECAHSNVSILLGGTLLTHPANERIYAGTGRAHLLSLCRAVGIPAEEKTYTLEELKKADEILVTSASVFCAPVLELDGEPVGGGRPELVRALQDALTDRYLKETNAPSPV